jgi:hypothetical protein
LCQIVLNEPRRYATSKRIYIEIEGFEVPVFMDVDVEGFEDPMHGFERMRLFEKPLNMRVKIDKKTISVQTRPL